MLASILAAGSIAFTAVPANAQTVRHHDTRHDVVKVSDNGEGASSLDPGRAQSDITWVRTTFSKKSLFLSMRFRKLTEQRRTQLSIFEITTSAGKHRTAVVNSGHSYPSGAATLVAGDGGYLHCPMQHHVSYRHAVVTVTIPARCLGAHARWVQVAFGEEDDPLNVLSSAPVYSDDGYGSGAQEGDTENYTFGPKVHRG